MTDQIHDQLDALHQALIKDAESKGEGPQSMRKSQFASEMERASFVTAYGQKAYDNLED